MRGVIMPRRDGTGPMGQGSMTGRRMGLGRGAGMGRRGGACNSMRKRCFRGFGRGM